jgi:hypothetical protein
VLYNLVYVRMSGFVVFFPWYLRLGAVDWGPSIGGCVVLGAVVAVHRCMEAQVPILLPDTDIIRAVFVLMECS